MIEKEEISAFMSMVKAHMENRVVGEQKKIVIKMIEEIERLQKKEMSQVIESLSMAITALIINFPLNVPMFAIAAHLPGNCS